MVHLAYGWSPRQRGLHMKRCVSCKSIRQEGSFYVDGSHPDDVCKPCIFRPRRTRVRVLRNTAKRLERTQAAVRYVVKHIQTEHQPYVYLVRVGDDFKIGYSTNVDKRIRQLETASPATVQLIAVAPGDRQLEQKLHQEFTDERIRHEWFSPRGRDLYIDRFNSLQNSMVFLPGYVKESLTQQ